MKIRVYNSDGVFRGGLFKTERVSGCRCWHGPPHPHHQEIMVDISGHGEPSREGSWFILRISKTPEIVESADGRAEFDGDSQAICVTSIEAKRWFKNSIYETPPDLLELARAFEARGVEDDSDEPAEAHEPLTEIPKQIWDLLNGAAVPGKELAMRCYGDPRKASAIRKHIETIRKTGRTVDTRRGFGYFRPDSPPSELAASVSAPELTIRQEQFQVE